MVVQWYCVYLSSLVVFELLRLRMFTLRCLVFEMRFAFSNVYAAIALLSPLFKLEVGLGLSSSVVLLFSIINRSNVLNFVIEDDCKCLSRIYIRCSAINVSVSELNMSEAN